MLTLADVAQEEPREVRRVACGCVTHGRGAYAPTSGIVADARYTCHSRGVGPRTLLTAAAYNISDPIVPIPKQVPRRRSYFGIGLAESPLGAALYAPLDTQSVICYRLVAEVSRRSSWAQMRHHRASIWFAANIVSVKDDLGTNSLT